MRRLASCLLIFQITALLASTATAGELMPNRLRCDYLENPLGLDDLSPQLSWIVTSAERGARQTAYQVLVASDEETLGSDHGNLWDSGVIDSPETAQLAYGGQPLHSRQRLWWKVRVWNSAGQVSVWSTPAWWETGLLLPADWHGGWIARNTDTGTQPLPLLRREFNLDREIKRARIYVTGLGYYELSLNGRRIGDHLLAPSYTRYDKRVLYETYDVTTQLQLGANCLAVMLGNGWFNVQTATDWGWSAAPWRASPRLLLELRVEFADGRTEIIVTDDRWKTTAGPIAFSSIYGGENYDARREQLGWELPGFNDHEWQSAVIVDVPGGLLSAQTVQPIKADRILTPVSVTEPRPGIYVFDVGQNLSGFAEISLAGPSGTTVSMSYGERLAQDGRVDRSAIGQYVWKNGAKQQFQTDRFVLAGANGREKWHSRFAYYGFRYIEVAGSPHTLTTDDLRVNFTHTAVAAIGHFECSNPLLNQIWDNTRWSYLSNLQGIFTDCPQREKNGWTGDAHLACEQGLLTYDTAAAYSKWIDDMSDEQRPSGEFPGIVPTSGWGYKWGNGPAWDSAFLLIPYYLYLYEGDRRPLESHYENCKRYVDYLTSKAKNGIVDLGLGDWSPWKTDTPVSLTSTAYYFADALIVAETAHLLSRADDERKYRALAKTISRGFNEAFYHPSTAQYANGSQTALSCPLYQGLVAPGDRARVLANLLAAITHADDHIDTGILGAKYLLNTLTDAGRADVAYRVVSQRTVPGWGYWVMQGATTLWENWNGEGSLNHIMFGDVSAWFTKTLAGINPDPTAPGFKHIIIRPNPVGDLTFAKGTYESIRGPIASGWTRQNGIFRLSISIPANCTATVWLPTTDITKVREGIHSLTEANAQDLAFQRYEDGYAIVDVESGAYTFTVGP